MTVNPEEGLRWEHQQTELFQLGSQTTENIPRSDACHDEPWGHRISMWKSHSAYRFREPHQTVFGLGITRKGERTSLAGNCTLSQLAR